MPRIASILFLLRAGIIIKCIGKRQTVVQSLLFTGLLKGLIGLANEDWVHIVVVARAGFMFAAVLYLLARPDFGRD